MVLANPRLRFCGYCGNRFEYGGNADIQICFACGVCGQITFSDSITRGPTVVVLTLVFAGDALLLIKRGQEPYQGKWAPPGGFVEKGESLESAAQREVREEVGLNLDKERLVPHALISLPSINQVSVSFIARIEHECVLYPCPPEALDARWFTESAFPSDELWGAGADFDVSLIYQGVRSNRFDLYQQSDNFLRFIRPDTSMQYLWRRT